MKYMGSKNRIAKHILPIMLDATNERGISTWVEPFVGGANMIDKVPSHFKRIGADINPYLIDALILIRDNPELIPKNNKEYTEDMYNIAKRQTKMSSLDALAMFQYSFGSKFKGGWAKNKRGTDYVKECLKNILIQSKKIKDVEFLSSSYIDLEIPSNSLIYCDPPYKGTTKYKDDFNHEIFWEWCRLMHEFGHVVFVSEYNAPKDFKSIWSQPILNTLNKETNKKIEIEKLFTIK